MSTGHGERNSRILQNKQCTEQAISEINIEDVQRAQPPERDKIRDVWSIDVRTKEKQSVQTVAQAQIRVK